MNKKIYFGLLAIGAVAVIATTNLNIASNKKGLSEISLANVEALALNEDPIGDCTWIMDTKECPNGDILIRGECRMDGDGLSCSCGAVTHKCKD